LDQNQQLLSKVLDGAVRLDQQLNLLLDLYDFFSQRYPDDKELPDLQVSIKALGQLPEMIALNLTAWRTNMEPTLSRIGFETNVLNEVCVHMQTMSTFFKRRGLDLEPYSPIVVRECMNSLRLANNIFGTTKTS
jgi:hypothetical protein